MRDRVKGSAFSNGDDTMHQPHRSIRCHSDPEYIDVKGGGA
jgi:hypothetical protein